MGFIISMVGFINLTRDFLETDTPQTLFIGGGGKVKGLVSLAQTSCVAYAHCPGGATNKLTHVMPAIDSDRLHRQDGACG